MEMDPSILTCAGCLFHTRIIVSSSTPINFCISNLCYFLDIYSMLSHRNLFWSDNRFVQDLFLCCSIDVHKDSGVTSFAIIALKRVTSYRRKISKPCASISHSCSTSHLSWNVRSPLVNSGYRSSKSWNRTGELS